MIFVTGPFCAGKAEYIQNALGLDDGAFAACSVRDVQELVPCDDLEALAAALGQKQVVIATELGGGVVPVEAELRLKREQAGRLACLLAARADTVIRVCCGLPELLKGEWP